MIQIYCTGLGAVDPPVAAGQAVPTDALHSATNSVTLTIGGVSVTPSFAGLTPGFSGLYQINATKMPAGVAPGSQGPRDNHDGRHLSESAGDHGGEINPRLADRCRQLAEGFSTWSMMRTPTEPLVASNLRPACSWKAVNNPGPVTAVIVPGTSVFVP